jgi:hypothetical protein
MPTFTLSCGPVQSMVQNQVYALPPTRALLYSEVAAATFEQSNTVGFALATALTPDANEQIEVAGGFIRLTSAGPVNVVLKRM